MASDSFLNPGSYSNGGSMSALAAISQLVSGITGTIVGGIQNRKTRKQQQEQWQASYDEAVRQYNQSYEQSERWNQQAQTNFENQAQIRSADMQKAGLNPLVGVDSNSGASFQSSSGNSPSGSSVSSSQLDFGSLVSALGHLQDLRQRKEEWEDEKKLREAELKFQETQEAHNYAISSGNLEYLNRRLDADIDNFNADLALRKDIAAEDYRHNLQVEFLEQQGLEAERAERFLQQCKQDDEYRVQMQKLEIARMELENAKTQADKDRKQRYFDTVFNGILRFIGKAADSAVSLVNHTPMPSSSETTTETYNSKGKKTGTVKTRRTRR